MKRSSQPWLLATTHILVIILGFVIGIRFASSLTFRQLVGLSMNAEYSQLARLKNAETPLSKNNVDFSLFWDVWARLERDYLDTGKMDAQQMVYGAIAGMTDAVGDPYTVFLPPETKQRLTEDLSGEFNGVGIQLGYLEGQLAVIAPLKGMPAEAAGVKPGDYILRIKDAASDIDTDTISMNAEEAVNLIRGKKNTKVTLTLLTAGENPRDIELTRDTIEIPSLELELVDHNNGRFAHIMLSRFGDKTLQEWEDVVAQIERTPVDGIILDMRGNPGGYLHDAIEISSDFVNGGVVVSQQGRNATQSYRTTRLPRLENVPVVVLVNKGSASASEIVAGALKDRRNALLIGEQTFGKGTVQDAQQLTGGAGLNITIARWLLPSGNSIQDSGLPVDIESSDNPETEADEVLEQALTALEN